MEHSAYKLLKIYKNLLDTLTIKEARKTFLFVTGKKTTELTIKSNKGLALVYNFELIQNIPQLLDRMEKTDDVAYSEVGCIGMQFTIAGSTLSLPWTSQDRN